MADRRRLRRGGFLLGLLGLFGAASGARADAVDDTVHAEMRDQHIPGLSLAVVRGGKVVKARGYGLASVELNAPATADTVYRLASVSKPIVATAVLLLARDGKLGLDDKIGRYLEKTPEAWREITIRQLLTHTSGLKDHLNELHGKTCNGTSPEEILAQMGTLPLNFAPGTSWLYSNTGYLVLQVIVKKVSGQSFDEFLAAREFAPLGMKSTRRNSPDDVILNRAAGYVWDATGNAGAGRLRNSPFLEPTLYDNADAGLLSTVLDLARWDAALAGTALLTAAEREALWAPVKLAGGATYPYGLGWHLETQHLETQKSDGKSGHRLAYHDGNRLDGATAMARYLDDQLTVIVLTNRGNANATRIAREVAGLYVPALAAVARPVADAEPKVTELIKTVLLKIQDGTIGPEPFTPEMWKGFYPAGAKAFEGALKSFGPFRSLALLSREAKGDVRSYRYRATFGETSLVIDCALTPDGKIREITGSQQ
jgi:CubicO group peptidase (beta-lactamase class C family)